MADTILPSFGIDITEYLEQEPRLSPSYSWKLNPTRNKIAGYVDELDSVQQACFCMLKTELGKYEIYPDWYGMELNDLYGRERDFVRAMLPMRIRECLSTDRRIQDVNDFDISFEGTRCICRFTVTSVFGEFTQEVEYDL